MMNFTLFYCGPLKSKGSPKDKHNLRKHFHPQLKQLWNQPPLIDFKSFYDSTSDIIAPGSIMHSVENFRFVPLVCSGLKLVARLELTILRPEAPGSLITTGGDIDNRLKTLFDSLKIPKDSNELSSSEKPNEDEEPFFCLLEDDNLVTEIAVKTKQFLKPNFKKSDVVVLLEVTTIKTGTLLGGMELP